MSTKIYLKEWVKPMAELHALSVVEDEMGLTDPESSEYKNAFEKAFFEFCEEFYSHSLVPRAMNPTIVKGINAFTAYNEVLFDGPQSFIKKNFQDPKEAETNIKQLKRAIGTIIRIYMQATFASMKFQYVSVGDEPLKKKQRQDQNRRVEINRYVRVFLLSVLMGTVVEIYNQDGSKIYNAIFDLFRGISPGDIRKKETNKIFAQRAKDYITSIFPKDITNGFVKFFMNLEK